MKDAQRTSGAAAAPSASAGRDERGPVIYLRGEWTLATLEEAESCLAALSAPSAQSGGAAYAVDLGGVTRLDSTGAMRINSLRDSANKGQGPLAVLSANPDFTALLNISRPPVEYAQPAAPHMLNPLALLDNLGRRVCAEAIRLQNIFSFMGQLVLTMGHHLFSPHKIRWTSLIYHMEQTGVRAVPIVALLSFLIGMVLAYMTASQLALFGAQIFVVTLLEVASFREMGGLLTAILVAGRSGSAFTAQIGAMVAGQEVDAMRSMGFDPMAVLVVPRISALVIMLPVLTLVADLMSLAGGMVALWASMDITPSVFIHTLQESINLRHLYVGLLKAPFFALVIGCTGCSLGFQVTGSAESVGRLTTKAVVESIFLVILIDALFALFFSTIGV